MEDIPFEDQSLETNCPHLSLITSRLTSTLLSLKTAPWLEASDIIFNTIISGLSVTMTQKWYRISARPVLGKQKPPVPNGARLALLGRGYISICALRGSFRAVCASSLWDLAARQTSGLSLFQRNPLQGS